WAYSKRDSAWGITGANCPSSTPATIARATQIERKRSNSPMRSEVLGVCDVWSAVIQGLHVRTCSLARFTVGSAVIAVQRSLSDDHTDVAVPACRFPHNLSIERHAIDL